MCLYRRRLQIGGGLFRSAALRKLYLRRASQVVIHTLISALVTSGCCSNIVPVPKLTDGHRYSKSFRTTRIPVP